MDTSTNKERQASPRLRIPSMSAQPVEYTPTTAFQQHSVTNPAKPHEGHRLDMEFVAINNALDETQARLAEIQRDDGPLRNESVHIEALSLRVRQLYLSAAQPRGQWTTGTHYHRNDYVEHNAGGYIAQDDHTASTDFSADRAHGHWLIVTSDGTAASTGNFHPTAWAECFLQSVNALEARSTLSLEDLAGPGIRYVPTSGELRVAVNEEEQVVTAPLDSALQFLLESPDTDNRLYRMSLATLFATLGSASVNGNNYDPFLAHQLNG